MWFGRVERKEKENWMELDVNIKIEGARPRAEPRQTWLEVVKSDMNGLGL